MRTFAAILLGTTLALFAVATTARAAQQQACKAEVEKFCKDVQKGQGRILKCLRDHDADLSADCRATVNTLLQHQACLDDSMQFCPNMKPSTAAIMKCLRVHQGDLSAECKDEMMRNKR